jgi:hypothetical protein
MCIPADVFKFSCWKWSGLFGKLSFGFEQRDTQNEISVNKTYEYLWVPLLSLQRIRFKEVAAEVSENEM